MRSALPMLAFCAALATACSGDEFASETGTGGGSGSGAVGGSGGATGGTGAAGASGGTGGAPTGGGTAGVAGATSGGTGGTGGAATGGTGTGGTGGAGGTGGTGGTATGGTGGTTSCLPKGGSWTIATGGPIAAEYPVIAGGYIYWSTNNKIFRNSVTGTPPSVETLYQGGTDVEGLAVDGNEVFHADPGAGAVRKTILGSQSPTSVGSSVGPQAVAVDATHVYWASSEGIRRRDRTLGNTLVESLYPSASAYAIGLYQNDIVWVTSTGLVYRAPKAGGTTPTPLHSHAGTWTAVSLAIDETVGKLYWTYALVPGDGGGVFIVPLSGGAAQHIVGQPGAEGITFSSSCIYWGVFNSGGSGIRARAKAGGSVEAFLNAGTSNRPRGLVADTDGLYWVDFVNGNVMKRFWQ